MEEIIEDSPSNQNLVAIDIGTNSFHVLIAKIDHGELRPVEVLSEKIQLGAGLRNGMLSNDSINSGLACLSRFRELISSISLENVRVVGTNALRKAKNRLDFIEPAQQILGVPIEVIYGREEARLIYLGVAHSLADDVKSRLVIDIGGGSTEFIIGQKFESQLLESLQIGCVSFAEKYFPDGVISAESFQAAYESAALEISHISGIFLKTGWMECVGSSGTLQSIEAMAHANGWSLSGIDLESLLLLKEKVLGFDHVNKISIEGLNENRRNVIITGLAITLAIFTTLNISSMRTSKGALREGVIYDLLGRQSHEDVRERSINALMSRYTAEQSTAHSVAARAKAFFNDVHEQWDLKSMDRDLLYWASLTHEIGMIISHKHYNRHSAYLLRNSDLPGFSQGEQEKLSLLTSAHRGKLKKTILDDFPAKERSRLCKMIALIRLAVLLKYSQDPPTIAHPKVVAKNTTLIIKPPNDWAKAHPLTTQALKEEAIAIETIGITLKLSQLS